MRGTFCHRLYCSYGSYCPSEENRSIPWRDERLIRSSASPRSGAAPNSATPRPGSGRPTGVEQSGAGYRANRCSPPSFKESPCTPPRTACSLPRTFLWKRIPDTVNESKALFQFGARLVPRPIHRGEYGAHHPHVVLVDAARNAHRGTLGAALVCLNHVNRWICQGLRRLQLHNQLDIAGARRPRPHLPDNLPQAQEAFLTDAGFLIAQCRHCSAIVQNEQNGPAVR
jgi:hypothetical protein